jgi:DNA invertase Pin-like site-specific DNA recombinase
MVFRQETAAMNPKAYSYLRFSTDEQRLGDSERRQLELSSSYAKAHGLDLVEDDFADRGISAFRGAHVQEGKFGRFMSDVRDGRIVRGSVLLVESFDRLSRQNPLDALDIFRALIQAGIKIVTLNDNREYSDTNSSDLGNLVTMLVIASRAHEESKTKSDRVAKAWANKRKNAGSIKLTAKCPAWLRLSADRKQYEKIEDRAAIVKHIFEQSAAGIGIYTIVRALNERRVPTFGSSREWHESYLKKILDNRATIGEFQPHRLVNGKRVPDGDVEKGYFPRVVSDDLFYRAKQGRAQRLIGDKGIGAGGRKGENISNLFQGVASCVYCGSKMLYINKGSGNTYLVCSKAQRGLGCEKTRWRYDDFEASFIEFVDELDIASVVNSDQHEQDRTRLTNEIESIKAKLTSLEQIRDRTYKLLGDETVSDDYLSKKFQELRQQIVDEKTALENKQQELSSLKSESVDLQELQDIIERLQGKGEDVYKLRAQIASRIKSWGATIFIASRGTAPLIEQEKKRGTRDPIIASASTADPELHKPWFEVRFWKQKRIILVQPNPDDPTKGPSIEVTVQED